jgi:two-component system cell cycle response regulator DivK
MQTDMRIRAMAGFQILIVEDQALHSTLARFLLEEAGHTVQVAENAAEALDVLRIFQPDLILMDLEMPGQDGVELTRELRLNPIHLTTPIIALTAYTDRSDLARARQAGCDGHISKPIDTAAFARQVLDCFRVPSAAHADVVSDSANVLAEIRNNFVAAGLNECGAMLKELGTNPACVSSSVQRVLHRWAGLGATLGFPEISNQARRLEALVSAGSLEMNEVVKGVETARRRFCAAARSEPKLSPELVRGLLNIRIGLVHFSEEEANRIRAAANRANARVVIERLNGDAVEKQISYDAVIINECGFSIEAARPRAQWTIPAVFIGSRASLESLAALPARADDFLIAPWEAEELLVRIYRLIAKKATPTPTAAPVHLQKRRSRVLIADDDPDLVSLVWQTLRQFGVECDIARSGQQALDAVSRHRPDAILLDINMFDLDGFEILKKLRQNLSTKGIPVLLLTARNQASDIARGFEYGANDYVVKPFEPLDLAKRLDKVIAAVGGPRVFP